MNKTADPKLVKRWNERTLWISSSSFAAPESSEAQNERIRRAKKDYAFFCETYFSHLAKKKCGHFHIDAANYIKKNSSARAVFEWARGHAKSTHLSLITPLWLRIQDESSPLVMILVSKSQDAAVRLLSDLQAELQFNELLKKDFGDPVKEGSWEQGEFKTKEGDMFIALGRGQSPRGIKERGVRPNYIDIDDIDDDELCRNPKRVNQVTEWCLTALLGTMEMGRGRFVMVGNLIGQISVLAQIKSRPGIYHTTVNALDKRGVPSWHENYLLSEIASIRKTMGERAFQKEYMNNPINEGAVFARKHIRFGPILPLKQYRYLVCYTDPSFKAGTSNDFKATLLVGKTKTGEFHVIKAYVDQTSVSDMIAWHYSINELINGAVPVYYYMESNFIQDLILAEFKKAGEKNGWQLPIRGDARKKPDKFARIEALQPIFERGEVIFNVKEKDHPGMLQLQEQLLMFEKGSHAHDDAPDALEGAIWMLSRMSRTTNAGYSYGGSESRHY
jgi:predicted phage terminase large subunit-like protein